MSKGFWEYQEDDEKAKPAAPAAEGKAEHVPRQEIAVNCYHHPDRRATSICPRCSIYFCSECMTLRKGKLICKTCAEVEFAVSDEQIVIGEDESLEKQIRPERPPDFNPYGGTVHSEGQFANPIVRILAFALDLIFSRIVYFVCYFAFTFIVLSMSGKFTPADFAAHIQAFLPNALRYSPWYAFFPADFLYFFTLLSLKNRTFGMSWLNLRIVTIYGDFVGFTHVWVRTIVMLLTLNVTELFAFFSPKRQSFHDWLAQVVVINYSGLKDVDPYETVSIDM